MKAERTRERRLGKYREKAQGFRVRFGYQDSEVGDRDWPLNARPKSLHLI
jgi:hypothetical protein